MLILLGGSFPLIRSIIQYWINPLGYVIRYNYCIMLVKDGKAKNIIPGFKRGI